MSAPFALALHGGAGPIRNTDQSREMANMGALLDEGRVMLSKGAASVEVVVAMIRGLEEAGYYIAGKGAAPNRDGKYELDASIMDGQKRRAGAVCALSGFRSPIAAARAVMDKTPHVLLAGAGAAKFCAEAGLEPVNDPQSYYTPAARSQASTDALSHGTVGCVALDRAGALCAGTSTGGVLNKMPGRVGDAPLIGAGTWADERVAISCTGQGEYFIRAAVAADVSARMKYAGMSVDAAAAGALVDMERQGGDGGLIAVDAAGRIALPFISHGMRRAACDSAGNVTVMVFR
ncbi:MAG: isoaspartyl peptidase/L-asparaginase [Robiginitomaculum sp.]|nr:MAG: isoaspartyl peptidase/L-asparaginase [Robiginitomaculum sp.]